VFIEGKESNDFIRRSAVRWHPTIAAPPATYAKFMNFHPFIDIESISPRPILFVVGDAAPSRTYTDTAYKMAAEPKELVEIKGANRIDLYDRTELIPWDKLVSFFNTNLKSDK
jgi:fermentation-respiration switch protein FrsA (DUF1100 family)